MIAVHLTFDPRSHQLPCLAITYRFPFPAGLPGGIVDLATEARGVAVLGKTETRYRIEIGLQGNKAIHRGPETVPGNGQDQCLDIARGVGHQVHDHIARVLTDAGNVLTAAELDSVLWVTRCSSVIEVERIDRDG